MCEYNTVSYPEVVNWAILTLPRIFASAIVTNFKLRPGVLHMQSASGAHGGIYFPPRRELVVGKSQLLSSVQLLMSLSSLPSKGGGA